MKFIQLYKDIEVLPEVDSRYCPSKDKSWLHRTCGKQIRWPIPFDRTIVVDFVVDNSWGLSLTSPQLVLIRTCSNWLALNCCKIDERQNASDHFHRRNNARDDYHIGPRNESTTVDCKEKAIVNIRR